MVYWTPYMRLRGIETSTTLVMLSDEDTSPVTK